MQTRQEEPLPIIPIRRAGPWATVDFSDRTGSAYVNRPDDLPITVTPDPDSDLPPEGAPVNCALNDWKNQEWEGLSRLASDNQVPPGSPDDFIYVYDYYSLDQRLLKENTGFDSEALNIRFYYQATKEFLVDFNWEIIPDTEGQNTASLTWSYATINGISDNDSLFLNGTNGTETITLPPDVLIRFSVSMVINRADAIALTIPVTPP